MFGKFSEQVQKSSKPVNSLVAVNTKALEEISQQQTEFLTGFLADSVKYIESLQVQTEVKGFVSAQSSYAEAVKERIAHTSKQTYGTINDVRDEYTKVLKDSLEDMPAADQMAKEMMKAATPATVETKAATPAPAKKAPAKKAPAKKATAKAAPKAAVADTPAPAKKAAPAPVKAATEAPKVTSKAAPAAEKKA